MATYVELKNAYRKAVDAAPDTRREALEAAQHLELFTVWPNPLVIPAAEPSP